jgi:sigma-B regulation protein RsbU (phosphoserine phosphatase)
LLLFIIMAVYFISNGIRKPVLRMKEIIQGLARGELTNEKLETKGDVIGQVLSSVNLLSDSFTQTSVFANEIGKGNLSVPYEKLSDKDVLGTALIGMQKSLRAYSEDMEQRVKERTIEVLEKSKKLEHAYKEIKDSINYAKRIQESILPAQEIISGIFSNYFIFYRPKDVVCGDFYWFGRTDKEIVIAAVDCTGHGVPGALMTVIGNSLLNQIVMFSGITSPSEILMHLDKKLEQTLKQHGGVATNDGMDMAVCYYKLGDNVIKFAGAKRPLYLFRNNELMEIKGSNAPIGSYGHNIDKKFAEHIVKIKKDDTMYMFSDGLQDQFGGLDGKKFMIKRFRDLLQKVHNFSMTEQKDIIEKEMSGWQQSYEQTDDMLLIGVKF